VVEKVVHKPTHKAAHKQVQKQLHAPQQKVLSKPAQKPLPKLNDVTPFLNFVEKNPIGAKLRGVVDSYASHGVYVKVGEISGYLAMRLMANPIPRSAREHVKLGTTLSLVVVGYTPSRRSVELAVAGMESLVLVKQTAKSSAQSSAQSAARSTKASAPRTQQTKKAKRRARHGKPVAKKSALNKKR
jgi:ribosomal protein S1